MNPIDWRSAAAALSVAGILVAGCGDGADELPQGPSLRADVSRGGNRIRIAAHLSHAGDAPLYYLSGCSALCRPHFYLPIYFRVLGPSGAEVMVEYACDPPLYCPEIPRELPPGASLDQSLTIDGTEWRQDLSTGYDCGTCEESRLEPGRYQVIATFRYSAEAGSVWNSTDALEATTQFDWP